MIREILTLVSDKVPLQYYIQFDKERDKFLFQPSLQFKSAPTFVILVKDGELITEGNPGAEIEKQARDKVKDILANMIFDRF